MRHIIRKDLVYGVGLAVLMYVVGNGFQEIFQRLVVVLLGVVLLSAWLYKKTYSQAIKTLINIVRVLQIPVIISFGGLGIGLYINRYNAEPFLFMMLLASLGSVCFSYKLLLDFTHEFKDKGKISIKKHRIVLLGIVGLWLLAEGTLLLVSM